MLTQRETSGMSTCCPTKIVIICPIHGDFLQTPDSHLSKKTGCPICKSSKGELLIYRDTLKKQHALDNGYKFLVIRYDEDIEKVLKTNLC